MQLSVALPPPSSLMTSKEGVLVTFITAFTKCLTKVNVGEKGLGLSMDGVQHTGKLVTPHLQSKSSGQMGNEVELTMSKPPSDSTRLPSMNVLQASITSPSTGNKTFKHLNLQGSFTLKPQNRVLLTQGCPSLGSTKKAPSSDIWGTFPRKLECKDSWAWSWEMVLSFRSATNSLCDPGQRGTVP